MTTNPLFEKDLFDKHRQNFYIVGVYKNRSNDVVFDTVSFFCLENGIPFRVEPFSNGVEEDRECILRLPAFHVYYKEEYKTTFYPEDSVKKVLLDFIDGLTKKQTSWWSSFKLFTLSKRKRISVVGSVSGV